MGVIEYRLSQWHEEHWVQIPAFLDSIQDAGEYLTEFYDQVYLRDFDQPQIIYLAQTGPQGYTLDLAPQTPPLQKAILEIVTLLFVALLTLILYNYA